MKTTDRQSLEQKLLESQDRLTAIMRTTTDAVVVIDERGQILVFNAAAERVFVCPAQNAIGTQLERFVPPRFRTAYVAAAERWLQTDAHVGGVGVLSELSGLKATGEEFPCDVLISQHDVGERREFTVIVRDNTERKRYEEALLGRVKFETFLFDLSRTFIGLSEEKVDVNMERGLAHVAEFLEMDRVTLLEMSRNREEMTVAYSWSAEAVARPVPAITIRHQPWWMGQTLRGEASLVSRVDDLPAEAALEKEYLRQRGVASAASIPVTVGGEIAGAISFVTVQRRVTWTEELVNQLRAVAEILWNALKRRQAMQALLAAQGVLRESEERFRLMADTAPVMVWMAGQDSLCHYFNRPWLEFTGRPLEAELGNGWTEGVHPDDFGHCMTTYVEAFENRESFRTEYRLRRFDGDYRWVLDSGVPRFNTDGSFAGYIGSLIDITDQKLAQETLSNLSQRLMQAQEEERASIARELHDDLAQRATTLVLRLQTLARDLSPGTNEHVRLQALCDQAFTLAKAIPALSHRLHSTSIAQIGIAAAAESLCQELSEQHQVTIDFMHEGIPENLAQDVAICLFRVLQESLTNAIRHAGVRNFTVALTAVPTEIQLTVSDAGAGFDFKMATKGRGLGLVSMKERLSAVGGDVVIESQPGAGTTVRVRVPLPRR
jgi:PAS domain S-box-containing protein